MAPRVWSRWKPRRVGHYTVRKLSSHATTPGDSVMLSIDINCKNSSKSCMAAAALLVAIDPLQWRNPWRW